ncbi:MAG: 4-(cytidine 5'-diphospho)-2-C-methyl-D-erythritol kinase [Planctomycetaceae bacterium]
MRIARQGETLVIDTPAKVNLFLEVLGRRDDGYHDLLTVMLAISLTDTLQFRIAAQPGVWFHQHLTTASPSQAGSPPHDDNNLVVRAARRLAEVAGLDPAVEISLWKRIPWQAGLGGGSSDAAATLVALNRLWGLQLPPADLHQLAATLGSDLNFFLAQSPLALCTSRGEIVDRQPLRRPLSLVIAQPEGGLGTADVFRRWEPTSAPRRPDQLLTWLAGDSHRNTTLGVYNALQHPAGQLHPGLKLIQQRLIRCGLQSVAMTGSGSACFGLAGSHRQAVRVARWMRGQFRHRAWAVRTWTAPNAIHHDEFASNLWS